ncbi:hypothetical protein ABIB30_005534 [Pedobacter sp. UYP1]
MYFGINRFDSEKIGLSNEVNTKDKAIDSLQKNTLC